MRDYTKIEAWKLADNLTVLVYEMTRAFPKEELYGLTSQLRRAVSSVPANIAEGSARGTNKDYLHFLYIARASLTEAHYFVHLSKRLGYIGDDKHTELESLIQKDLRLSHRFDLRRRERGREVGQSRRPHHQCRSPLLGSHSPSVPRSLSP